MKVIAALLSLGLWCFLFSCSTAKLDTLQNYTGKYIVYSTEDIKFTNSAPYGIYIEKEHTDYYLSVWYETFTGEKQTAKEKISVSGMGYKPGSGRTIKALTIQNNTISCSAEELIYETILTGTGPVRKKWICRVYDASLLAVFDKNTEEINAMLDSSKHINSDISRARGILTFKRIETRGIIRSITTADNTATLELETAGNINWVQILLVESTILESNFKGFFPLLRQNNQKDLHPYQFQYYQPG